MKELASLTTYIAVYSKILAITTCTECFSRLIEKYKHHKKSTAMVRFFFYRNKRKLVKQALMA
jgi:hypothetical protein